MEYAFHETSMIVLTSSTEPIEFPTVSHALRRTLSRSADVARRWHFSDGGAARVRLNVEKELAMRSTGTSWGFSFRDVPRKGSVDAIWVVSGAGDLRWALEHRPAIGARELWAGPDIVVTPQEKDGLLLDPRIDRVVVPSDWVAAFYEQEAPPLAGKCCSWPVGIDTDFWQPTTAAKDCLLIYNKRQDALFDDVKRFLNGRSVAYETIVYGSYEADEYRSKLDRAWGMVWLSRSESQGLAALEAMSMNVPLLAWDPGEGAYDSPELKKTFHFKCSSVPYFDARCGARFSAFKDFDNTFDGFIQRLPGFRPREFIHDSQLDLRSNLKRMPLFNPSMKKAWPA